MTRGHAYPLSTLSAHGSEEILNNVLNNTLLREINAAMLSQ